MKSVVLTASAVLLSACASQAPYPVASDPSSPDAPYRPARYVSVTAGTASYRPVEPKPWLKQNEEAAPRRGTQP